jgi:hypothetical protein
VAEVDPVTQNLRPLTSTSARTGEERALQPLSERALARLGGRRAFWIAAWALVPWVNAGANLLLGTNRTSAVWEQSAALVVLNYAAISFAVVASLWGAGTLARRLEALQTTTSDILVGEASEPFRGVNTVAGPLVASGAAAIVFAGTTLVDDGWLPGVVRGATWFVLGIALFSFIWTYGSVLLGLNRLGRARVDPETPHVDPGLGLQPLGGVASTGLWMLLVWLVPVLLTGLPDIVGAVIGMLVLGAALATFFLSMLGLHRQMVDVKNSELALARELYARAYQPVHASPTLEVLEQQRSLLAAADALEKRAGEIHEWPFAERTPTLVITVITSVVAMTIGRLILDPIGL